MHRPLPIDSVLPAVVESARVGNVVVTAPPGSGKTTRVPPALEGRVIVVEPRRLATRMAATWVAEERGGPLGGEVGYQVRFDSRCGPSTRVVYVTEGVLARRLVDDADLRGIACVVLDEFHERHLHADVALAMLRRLQQETRPDLRLIAMSATLDAAPLAAYLGDCPIVAAEGRLHPVEVEHEDDAERPLEARVAAAMRRALDRDAAGDVLVFLPGAAEIRRAMEACAGVAALHDVELVPLHGDLSLEAQAAAVRPGTRRRAILSTNVAESSITVEGVTVVIDSGLARVASTSPWSGLDELRVEKISRASADQRTGRAGRVRPGRCVRLYPRYDYERRAAHDVAEIHRVDLSETLLLLHGAGVADAASLPWFEPLSAASVTRGEALLAELGAVEQGALTTVGRRMLSMPLHPRLARLVVEAERRGVADLGCAAAALLSERDIRLEARARLGRGGPRTAAHAGSSDVAAMIDAYRRRSGVDAAGARRVAAVEQQVRRALGEIRRTPSQGEEGLLKALLVAWPDRVAKRRGRDRASELLLSGGGTAKLSEQSVVQESEWLVTVDAEVRSGGPLVRVASQIEVDWLLDLFIERVSETDERVWNEKAGRVEAVRRMMYDRLVIDETRGVAPRDEATAAMLAEAVLKAGAAAFADMEAVDAFLHRVAFAADALPEAGLHAMGDEDVRDTLRALCAGAASSGEVRAAAQGGGFLDALRQRLPSKARAVLERAAPTQVALSARRRVAVHYEPQRPPWIASRLQDFFGLREGPRVAEGRVPLVLHLLAPNQRPVQVTTDLAGFWVRTYPQVRKELARRYPRHAWPEDPLSG